MSAETIVTLMFLAIQDFLTYDPRLEEYRKQGVFKLWLGPFVVILLTRPETVAAMLSTTDFNDKSSVYEKGHDFLGDSLLMSSGTKWKIHRRIMNPALHSKSYLKTYVPIVWKNSRKLVEDITQRTQKTGGIMPRVNEVLSHYLIHLVIQSLLGLEASDEVVAQLLENQDRVMELIFERIIWYRNDFLFRLTAAGKEYDERVAKTNLIVADFVSQGAKKLTERDNNSAGENSVLDILLQEHFKDPKGFDYFKVKDEVMVVFAAGHDTSSWGLVWTLLELGHRPELQEEILHEIDEFVRLDEVASLDVLNQMKFTESVILESLRLYPTAAGFSRKPPKGLIVTQDGKEHKIPAGSDVHIVPFMIHRSQDVWEKAESFDPYRFFYEDATKSPYAYLSFAGKFPIDGFQTKATLAGGPRTCLGKKFALIELKIALIFLIKNFKITSLVSIKDVILDPVLFLRSSTDINLKFERRS